VFENEDDDDKKDDEGEDSLLLLLEEELRLLSSFPEPEMDGGCCSCCFSTLFSIMSTSPTRVDPSLKRTRFLWARRQFCLSSSRMASMAEQILSAGPNLMDMADIK